jgi:phosphoglycerate dehydrogenase-like enzyme
MPRPIVLVTRPEYRRGEPAFQACADFECVPATEDEASLVEAIERMGVRYLVVGSVKYGVRLYEAVPRGGVVARFGVGYDSIDKSKATRSGVLCTNTPDVLPPSVAELAMLMIAAAARHLPEMTTAMHDGEWRLVQGIELHGKTVAIVGCGAIGQATARIASRGFGMRAVGYSRRPAAAMENIADRNLFDFVSDDFAAVVRDADFVSLHIPGSPENARFVDDTRFRLFPERAWLINTARGAVVDETALYDALVEKRLAGAALDVFQREPYQPVDPTRDLRTLPQVILLPHVGSHTFEANRRMAERALQNIRLAAAGDFAVMDLINREVLQPAREDGN